MLLIAQELGHAMLVLNVLKFICGQVEAEVVLVVRELLQLHLVVVLEVVADLPTLKALHPRFLHLLVLQWERGGQAVPLKQQITLTETLEQDRVIQRLEVLQPLPELMDQVEQMPQDQPELGETLIYLILQHHILLQPLEEEMEL
jgi:hypothetical protein